LLRDIHLGKEARLGKRVVVVGGGNVAIDSARVALRLGASEVSIVYRRSREEMPAIRDEVEEAEREGVTIRYMASPCRIVCEGDKCVGLECLETELGEPDESGRRRPIQVQGSEFVVDADMVILAIGETPDLSFLETETISVRGNGTLEVNPFTMATSVEGVFAGGDVVTGPASVVQAISAGRKAAQAIDKYLRGERLDFQVPIPEPIPVEHLDTSFFKRRRRQRMRRLSPKNRIKGFREVELGFDELEALREADRCLQCGMFPKK